MTTHGSALLAVGLATVSANAATAQSPPAPIARIAFELHRNKILVPVHIDGRGPYSFVLDTGAPATVLNSWAHARTLALEVDRRAQISGAGEGEAPPAGISQEVRVAVGGIDVGATRLIVVDLADGLASASGRYYDGIIGQALFDRYVVRIDFERGLVELYEPTDYRPPHGANVIPIRMERGHPHFDTRVTLTNGDLLHVDLVIDTGGRTALILDGDLSSVLARPDNALDAIIGRGARGWVRGRIAWVAAVTLGDTTVRDVLAAFVDDAVGATPGADGNLGIELLRRFAVTFDYARGRMVLEPRPSLRDPFPVDLSGVTLRAGGDDWSELSVADVRPRSAAMLAGIQVDDAIHAVDGAAPPALDALERRFELTGVVELELVRGDRTLTVTMELRPVSF